MFEARLMQNPMAIRPSPQAAPVRNGLPSPVKWNAPGKHWKSAWPWQPSRKSLVSWCTVKLDEASRYSWMMLDVHPKKCPFLVLDLIVLRQLASSCCASGHVETASLNISKARPGTRQKWWQRIKLNGHWSIWPWVKNQTRRTMKDPTTT